MKAGKAILGMDYLNYLLELPGTSREMDTELSGVLLSLRGNRDRFQYHHRRSFAGNLLIKHQLPVAHRAVRVAIGKLNGRKHETVHHLKGAKRESLEQSFHGYLLSDASLSPFIWRQPVIP
jgi:hypothetical protein